MLTDDKKFQLGILVKSLASAKTDEENAKKDRISFESAIAKMLFTEECQKKSEQTTVQLQDGSKVTVKRGLSYKADLEGMTTAICEEQSRRIVVGDVRSIHWPVKTIPEKEEFDLRAYEWYRLNNPELFRLISKFVTVTPSKAFVSVKASKE